MQSKWISRGGQPTNENRVYPRGYPEHRTLN